MRQYKVQVPMEMQQSSPIALSMSMLIGVNFGNHQTTLQ